MILNTCSILIHPHKHYFKVLAEDNNNKGADRKVIKSYRSDWTENPIRKIEISNSRSVKVTLAGRETELSKREFKEIINFFQKS